METLGKRLTISAGTFCAHIATLAWWLRLLQLQSNAALQSQGKDRSEGAPSGICGELEGLRGGDTWGSTVLPLALLAPSAPAQSQNV